MKTVDQLNPANGDVADGRRVLLGDGSVASVAQVSGGLLLVHAGTEFGPFTSLWRLFDELCRLDGHASGRSTSAATTGAPHV
ncbi:hypothetical protein [Xanthomonas sacchari]|uniref:hypothetical protein n=1 Tax=Xanthomonas sacchari TaxID=56458 RepID=UPI00225E5F12|nr:hypothetical protein [Xanthomonas sacchari]